MHKIELESAVYEDKKRTLKIASKMKKTRHANAYNDSPRNIARIKNAFSPPFPLLSCSLSLLFRFFSSSSWKKYLPVRDFISASLLVVVIKRGEVNTFSRPFDKKEKGKGKK